MKYTGMVGRKRKNAVRTADSGISSRGKGVFSSNLPELVTDVAPLVIEYRPAGTRRSPRVRWAKKAGSLCRRMIVTRM